MSDMRHLLENILRDDINDDLERKIKTDKRIMSVLAEPNGNCSCEDADDHGWCISVEINQSHHILARRRLFIRMGIIYPNQLNVYDERQRWVAVATANLEERKWKFE
ncbi:hypothetical protein LCGC14_0910120 [marine sediment metagenome]|uniref:Uncharacterized protein n=1 Tax=marine sediment metagenome TaxID=412755 RepID=A0A0F9PEN2_9ZZZZ